MVAKGFTTSEFGCVCFGLQHSILAALSQLVNLLVSCSTLCRTSLPYIIGSSSESYFTFLLVAGIPDVFLLQCVLYHTVSLVPIFLFLNFQCLFAFKPYFL